MQTDVAHVLVNLNLKFVDQMAKLTGMLYSLAFIVHEFNEDLDVIM